MRTRAVPGLGGIGHVCSESKEGPVSQFCPACCPGEAWYLWGWIWKLGWGEQSSAFTSASPTRPCPGVPEGRGDFPPEAAAEGLAG